MSFFPLVSSPRGANTRWNGRSIELQRLLRGNGMAIVQTEQFKQLPKPHNTHGGYAEYLALTRNSLMHALHGNGPKAKPVKLPAKEKKSIKKVVKQAVREAEKPKLSRMAPRRIRGSGDYTIGGKIGSTVGSKIGGWVGDKVHSWVAPLLKIIGVGDYDFVGNPAGSVAAPPMPEFSTTNGGNHAVIIAHAEYTTPISMTKDFAVTTYDIDPTNVITFPWLSAIAPNFARYRITGLYVTVTSSITSTPLAPNVGTITMGARYDVDSKAPTTRTEILNSMWSQTAQASRPIVAYLETSSAEDALKLRYVRKLGNNPSDPAWAVQAKFDICTEGSEVDIEGALTVAFVYRIEFYAPVLPDVQAARMFMADLACNDNTNPLRFIPDTAYVKQPRINTAAMEVQEGGVIRFSHDYPIGSTFIVFLAFDTWTSPPEEKRDKRVGVPYPSVIPTTGNFIHCERVKWYDNQGSDVVQSFNVIDAANYYDFRASMTIVIRITEPSTPLSPPGFKIAYDATMYRPGGVFMVTQVDPDVASGLTSTGPSFTSRDTFIEWLVSICLGTKRPSAADEFDNHRLIDLCNAFLDSPLVLVKKVRRGHGSDIGVSDAVDRMRRFMSQATLKRISEHDFVRIALNGNQGSWTGTDDVILREVIKGKHAVTTSVPGPADADEVLNCTTETKLLPGEVQQMWLGFHTERKCDPKSLEDFMALGVRINHCEDGTQLGKVPRFVCKETLIAIDRARESRGWKRPGLAAWYIGSEDFWLVRASRVLCRLITHKVITGWTMNELRRYQCTMICGGICRHIDYNECPGSVVVIVEHYGTVSRPNVDHNDTLMGSHGSFTQTDDHMIVPCANKPCYEPKHYHPRRRGNDKPMLSVLPQTGNGRAAQTRVKRRAAAMSENKLRVCTWPNGVLKPLNECKLESHYHVTAREVYEDLDAAVEEMVHSKATSREFATLLNEHLKAGSREEVTTWINDQGRLAKDYRDLVEELDVDRIVRQQLGDSGDEDFKEAEQKRVDAQYEIKVLSDNEQDGLDYKHNDVAPHAQRLAQPAAPEAAPPVAGPAVDVHIVDPVAPVDREDLLRDRRAARRARRQERRAARDAGHENVRQPAQHDAPEARVNQQQAGPAQQAPPPPPPAAPLQPGGPPEGNDGDGGGGGDGGDGDGAGDGEERERERVARRNEIIGRLTDIAVGKWLTKTIGSSIDRETVIRYTLHYAENEKLRDVCDNTSAVVIGVVADAERLALQARQATRDVNMYSSYDGWRKWFALTNVRLPMLLHRNECQKLRDSEEICSFTVPKFSTTEMMVAGFGIAALAAIAYYRPVWYLKLTRKVVAWGVNIALRFLFRLTCSAVVAATPTVELPKLEAPKISLPGLGWVSNFFKVIPIHPMNVGALLIHAGQVDVVVNTPDYSNVQNLVFGPQDPYLKAIVEKNTTMVQVDPEAYTYNAVWTFCIQAPILEELVKRGLPLLLTRERKNLVRNKFIAGACFGALEGFCQPYWGAHGILGVILRAFCHGTATAVPLAVGILGHSVWNTVAVARDVFIVNKTGYAGKLMSDMFNNQIADHTISQDMIARVAEAGAALAAVPAVGASLGLLWGMQCLAIPYVFNRYAIQRMESGIETTEAVCALTVGLKKGDLAADFKYKLGPYHCKPAIGARCYWGIAGVACFTYAACTHNEEVSVCNRVGKNTPAKRAGLMPVINRHWRTVARGFLGLMLRNGMKRVVVPMKYEEWLSTFEPRRRQQLNDYKREGYNMHDPKERLAKAFIKQELTPMLSNSKFKDPRWIQGCPLSISLEAGRHLRPLADQFCECFAPNKDVINIQPGRQIIYTCGRTCDEVGDWFRYCLEVISKHCAPDDEVRIVEDDQSRYDLHIPKGGFDAADLIYSRLLTKRPRLALKRGRSRGVSGLGTTYSVDYTMQSGWPDTSCLDTILNALMKNHIHGEGNLWLSIICGDDSVTVTTRNSLEALGGCERIVQEYAKFGMEVTMEVRRNPLDVEFCSSRFYPCRGTYVLMPKPGRLLSKILWDMQARSPRRRVMWFRSVSSTLRSYGRIDPLMLALGDMIYANFGDGEMLPPEPYKFYISESFNGAASFADVATYYDYHYGLGEKDILELCALIRQSGIGRRVDDSRLVEVAVRDLS